MLKRIWNDPVWSKVISAAILLGAGWVTHRLNWWPGWMTRKIASVWAYLVSRVGVPLWLLALLILVATIAVLFAAFLLWVSLSARRHDVAEPWRSYTSDLFDGLRWRWRYENGAINHLFSFCPACDYQVLPDNMSRFSPTVGFHCDGCGRNLGAQEGPYENLVSRVTRLIQQKLRNGDWHEVVARQTSTAR